METASPLRRQLRMFVKCPKVHSHRRVAAMPHGIPSKKVMFGWSDAVFSSRFKVALVRHPTINILESVCTRGVAERHILGAAITSRRVSSSGYATTNRSRSGSDRTVSTAYRQVDVSTNSFTTPPQPRMFTRLMQLSRSTQ